MSNQHTDIAARAEKTFADHVLRAGPGFSWRMAKPGSSDHWFRVTWGPGFLVLTGDLGSMVVTHYCAAIELWDAIHWLHRADYDYLMGKTDRRQEFDAESTAREIVSRIYED